MKIGIQSRELSEKSFSRLADDMSAFVTGISLKNNMDSTILERISIPAGEEIKLSHNLKKVPRHRIITRQVGNSLITDGDDAWTDKYITLKNNGAKDVLLSICILGG